MNPTELNENFAIPGALWFESDNPRSLTRLQVRTHSAHATLYLQGAHLTHWQPTGHAPVLFLSPQSEFAPAKAIRGGIPICFPWFGPRTGGPPAPAPAHGFARIQDWDFAFAAYIAGTPEAPATDCISLSFVLHPSALSRSLGFDHFRAEYRIRIGATLTLELTVANLGPVPLHFEEALHTYFAVADVRQASITGLESAPYLDKTDAMRQKTTPAGPLALVSETDRVFPGNTATATIQDSGNDPGTARTITNRKRDSATTVIWNPWSALPDLGPEAWPHFLCLETANTAADSITLAPNETHTMATTISVEKQG